MTEIKKLTDDDLNLVTGGKKPEKTKDDEEEVKQNKPEMVNPCR